MSSWPLAFFELFIVLAFGIGWLILEWYCKRLDKPTEAEAPPAIEASAIDTSPTPADRPKPNNA